ncbi:hypothetical protein [Streptomyces sp. 891-h]|uniref:hypothetical protein n=1 Tax=unclassified Streptomyces TaxID=2593676 RepID=UPI001FAB1CB0|nr:hypothetical protein [Streptomyces sp. 891-h]UNZ21081.1 hypothetical protein HC362_32365 [Streptomyces sp. 891-h]
MRRRQRSWSVQVAVVALTLLTMLAGPVPAASAAALRAPAENCATTLRCDLAELERVSMADRVEMVRDLQRRHGPAFEPGFRRWAAIAGVMSAARDRGVGGPGTWMSVTNAGLLEAMERGVARGLDPEADVYGNPGALRWSSYLTNLAAGRLTARPRHDEEWSKAEQASLDHGDRIARTRFGLRPTPSEQRFKQLTDLYRWAMQHEKELPAQLGALTPVLWWFTDVRNEDSYRISAEIAMTISFGPPGIESLTRLLLEIQLKCPTCTAPLPIPVHTGTH